MNPSDINKVHFRYMDSMSSYETDIKIRMEKEPLIIVKAFRGFENSDIDTSFQVSINKIKELKEAIKLLNNENFIDKTMGVDGSYWMLEYDINGKTKTFEVWSPEVDTKNRKLELFMSVCKQIMEIAKLDPDSVIEES
jgi:uncharacterized membrane protein YukC